METKDQVTALFQKYVTQTITPEERVVFFTLIDDHRNDPKLQDLLTLLWEHIESKYIPGDRGFDNLQGKIQFMDGLMAGNGQSGEVIKETLKKLTSDHPN
ncbi:hypothetical protein QQ020_35165 [Fulvivirgaceae bacterium BMA12]|uniref:Uncharacterized protein n=1 Tax=Agaribacillus aureus TaxID=3051825 RepID=A0ABT8LM08_9BACT|nr:hypothetical protein [Fulvivirgaceae bacterium BMA12]